VFTTTLCTIVAIAALAALTLDAVGCGADSSPSQRQPVAPSPTGSPMTARPSATPTPPGSADSINVLYSFDGTHGADPKGSLVLGELASSCYDSVKHVPYRVLFSFQNGTGTPSGCSNCTGSTPRGRPVVVNIGTMATPIDVLLEMTRQGGYTSGGNSKGNVAIYAYTPSANAYTVLHLFGGSTTDGGSQPIDNLTPSADGVTFYGMTQTGGANDDHNNQIAISFGTVFSILAAP
jgi:hypothetical protein